MSNLIPFLKYKYHLSDFYKKRLIKNWNKENNPHKIKEKVIIEYSNKYRYAIFIETGTYLGEMVYSLKNVFKYLYTIEISVPLYKTAKKHFSEYDHINFIQGDSGTVLSQIVDKLTEPAIFWLDGHYSGGITEKGESETPILKELKSIFESPYSHLILIDDARCFGNPSFPDYPDISELEQFVHKSHPEYHLEIEDDIIRLKP